MKKPKVTIVKSHKALMDFVEELTNNGILVDTPLLKQAERLVQKAREAKP